MDRHLGGEAVACGGFGLNSKAAYSNARVERDVLNENRNVFAFDISDFNGAAALREQKQLAELRAAGREPYLIALRDLTPENLVPFRHLDAFVVAACPRIGIDDQHPRLVACHHRGPSSLAELTELLSPSAPLDDAAQDLAERGLLQLAGRRFGITQSGRDYLDRVLEQIESRLGASLDDPQVRVDAWVALQVSGTRPGR